MLVDVGIGTRRDRATRLSGWVRVAPGAAELLSVAGLRNNEDFFEMPGEIISGHPGRNVARVTLMTASGPVQAFLKREHHVSWFDRLKNWRDGFGWCSVSVREATTLERLAERQVNAPPWLAVGEDDTGRAFLLVRAVEGLELRRYLLRLRRRPLTERIAFYQRLATVIAGLHESGFAHPDLYAKHVLVNPKTTEISILDWQRTGRPATLTPSQRARDLAALHASIADELADAGDRQAFLAEYCKHAHKHVPNIRDFRLLIESVAARRLRRSSVREQRLPTWQDSQPLVWLAGEALAVTPRCRAMWSAEDLARLAYGMRGGAKNAVVLKVLTNDLRTVRLTQRRTVRPFGPVLDWWRGQRWTAPELRSAAHLLRQERLGAAPKLLAFGQRFLSGGVVESFLLEDADAA